MSFKFYTLFICSLLTAFLLSSSIDVKANEKFKAANSFQIASIFYKLVDRKPDFAHWASYTNAYEQAQRFDKETVLQEQEIKLRELFYNTFVDEVINIQAVVNLQNYSDKQNKLFLPEISKDTIFNYSAFGENFAVIALNLERYDGIDLTLEQLAKLTGSAHALIEFTLKPIQADDKAPLIIDNEPHWIILADIAQVRLWDNNRTFVTWSDKADWYKNTNEGILDLYAE